MHPFTLYRIFSVQHIHIQQYIFMKCDDSHSFLPRGWGELHANWRDATVLCCGVWARKERYIPATEWLQP